MKRKASEVLEQEALSYLSKFFGINNPEDLSIKEFMNVIDNWFNGCFKDALSRLDKDISEGIISSEDLSYWENRAVVLKKHYNTLNQAYESALKEQNEIFYHLNNL